MSEATLADASPGPARPDRLTVDFLEEADALVIHKRRAGGPWVFLLLWLIGWTVGCIDLLVTVLKDPKPWFFVVALPFWASWLFVAAMLVWMLFGKETLLLTQDAAEFRRTALIRLSSRFVPREEVQGFRECASTHTENDQHLWGIEMVTLGKPVRFAFRLPDRERAWLVCRLNRFLATSRPSRERRDFQPAAPVPPDASFGGCPADGPPAATEVLTPARTLAEPPTDCNWRLTDDPEAVEFGQRGRLRVGALAGLLFFNAFWNGIVVVFVMGLFGLLPGKNLPQGWGWWGMFVFLIPFEGIGLAMLAALLLTLLEPFGRTAWRLERDRITRHGRWCGFRHTRSWDVARLDRLELRRHRRDDVRRPRVSGLSADAAGPAPFGLACVTSDNVDLCEIDRLTEGEARWMARIVFDHRPEWFGKSGVR